jgi:hypothetical protein
MEKNPTQRSLKIKRFMATQSYPYDKKYVLLGHNNITKDWTLIKISSS